MAYTKKERGERWEVCKKYLRLHGNLPDAMRGAAWDGISYNSSVWITALSKLLQDGEVLGEGRK